MHCLDRSAKLPGNDDTGHPNDGRNKDHRPTWELNNVTGILSLPGMVTNTSPTDYRVNKQLQMMKFNGERWELFGPILGDAGPAG